MLYAWCWVVDVVWWGESVAWTGSPITRGSVGSGGADSCCWRKHRRQHRSHVFVPTLPRTDSLSSTSMQWRVNLEVEAVWQDGKWAKYKKWDRNGFNLFQHVAKICFIQSFNLDMWTLSEDCKSNIFSTRIWLALTLTLGWTANAG